ncbi:hypothetical protein D9M68_294940 [compost metagenome]
MGFALTLQPKLRLVRRTELAQALQVGLTQGLGVAQQQRRRGAVEQLHVSDRLRLVQALEQPGQRTHQWLQGLYQHQAILDSDYRLAGSRAKSHVQLARLDVPAHGNAGTPPVTEVGPHKWGYPFLRMEVGDARQLLGQRALFQGKLLGMGQVLQGAAAALAGVGAGRHQAYRAGTEHTFGTGFHHLAAGGEHAGFHFFLWQGAGHEPGAPFDEGNAASVVGQALDDQPLLLAHGNLRSPRSAAGLEAQAGVTPGHWGLRKCR